MSLFAGNILVEACWTLAGLIAVIFVTVILYYYRRYSKKMKKTTTTIMAITMPIYMFLYFINHMVIVQKIIIQTRLKVHWQQGGEQFHWRTLEQISWIWTWRFQRFRKWIYNHRKFWCDGYSATQRRKKIFLLHCLLQHDIYTYR